jgi:hypothetical protein
MLQVSSVANGFEMLQELIGSTKEPRKRKQLNDPIAVKIANTKYAFFPSLAERIKNLTKK